MIQTKQTEKGQEILRVLFNVYYTESFLREIKGKEFIR